MTPKKILKTKTPAPKPKKTPKEPLPTIDPAVLARINAKIESAHQQIESLGKAPKRAAPAKQEVAVEEEI
jgi:hypothetical protein